MTDIKPLAINGNILDRPIIISGPCSAETEEQVLTTAKGLARAGVKIYRAGIWKPRTKPGGFEGVGVPGLQEKFHGKVRSIKIGIETCCL